MQIDGWTDARTDGQRDRWMERWTIGRYQIYYLHLSCVHIYTLPIFCGIWGLAPCWHHKGTVWQNIDPQQLCFKASGRMGVGHYGPQRGAVQGFWLGVL